MGVVGAILYSAVAMGVRAIWRLGGKSIRSPRRVLRASGVATETNGRP
jgi:hypothetical protein